MIVAGHGPSIGVVTGYRPLPDETVLRSYARVQSGDSRFPTSPMS